jgi:pilus assembly protein CpaE
MVALFNPRGGVGCTSVALNLGGALQRQGRRVVIVDMDLQLATLPSSLQVKLERSLAELVMEASQTEGPLQSALDQHHSGLTIIAQEERISEISMVTPDRLPRFFEALRAGFDVVLIDGLRNFSDLAVSVMDEADVVTMVLTQDIPAVRSARKALKLFQRLGYDNAKGRVVLNRFHKRAMISDAVIEDHLGVMLTSRLPNDFKFVSRALAEGELLHVLNPKHPFTLAIDELAAQLVGYELQVKRGGGLLNKLTSMIKRS